MQTLQIQLPDSINIETQEIQLSLAGLTSIPDDEWVFLQQNKK
jgi:hypothetical protein